MKSFLSCALFALATLGCGGGGDDDNPTGADATVAIDADTAAIDAAVGSNDADTAVVDAAPAIDSLDIHTENNSGVMHAPGKADPLANCVSCHGNDLTGGAGPSCYTCHDNDNHTINRSGAMHLGGSSSGCLACHGPGNSGGLGPACTSCH